MILLSIIAFFAFLLLGLDVGFSMITAALLGMALHAGGGVDPVMAPLNLVSGVDSAALVTVPLFILAGEAMNRGGVTARLIAWSSAMVGHLRGSLSQVAVLTNLVMAGITGSAVADATATGGLMIPAMRAEGYKPGYAAAVIAASAMLGPILPPSIPMILYGIMANVSIVKLFLGGVGPALLLTTGYMVLCGLTARRRRYPAKPRASWTERASVTRASLWALFMPVLIIGGIRSGLITVTEAAGVICLYALGVGLLVYRGLRVRELPGLLYSAGRTSAVVLFLLAAAGPFAWLLNEAHIATAISNGILGISNHPLVVLLVVNLLLLAVGMILEPLPALVMFVPTLLPIQAKLGYDPIHFAVVVIVNLMIGMLHPPVGLLIFVTSAVGRVPLWEVAWEVLPFLAWALIVLALISIVPSLVTFLPSTLA